jgi:hypothetical protein
MTKKQQMTVAMGYKNPGATPNLRGVEKNTARNVKVKIKKGR